MGCTTNVGLLLVVRLVAILGGMVVRRMAEGLSLIGMGAVGGRSQLRLGGLDFLGLFGTFRAGHGGHGLGGGGQGGGCGSGEGWATYFAGVLSPGVVRGGPGWCHQKAIVAVE